MGNWLTPCRGTSNFGLTELRESPYGRSLHYAKGPIVGLKAHLRSNLVGYIALFCSLSLGTAWAATELTRNSVKSRHIAKGNVKRSDLARNAVNSPRVANGSLRAADFAEGQLPAGLQGPPGEPGESATSLFAYILDQGPSSAATVSYGSGATSVEDPDGDGASYIVTFDRALDGCVAFATTGSGAPSGAAAGGVAFGEFVDVLEGSPGRVFVDFFNAAGTRRDGSFLISVFC